MTRASMEPLFEMHGLRGEGAPRLTLEEIEMRQADRFSPELVAHHHGNRALALFTINENGGIEIPGGAEL